MNNIEKKIMHFLEKKLPCVKCIGIEKDFKRSSFLKENSYNVINLSTGKLIIVITEKEILKLLEEEN